MLIKRSLVYYWRTNLAVVLGVGVAVAVLAGALLVGASVRASLRELALGRLGETDYVLAGENFFRETLADEIRAHANFNAAGLAGACPLIVIEGSVIDEASGRRSAGVQVYGVDKRFWQFHGKGELSLGAREIVLSAGLAEELGSRVGETLLLRVERPQAIPAESLHGRRENVGRTLRLTMRAALTATEMGEFSLRPQQGAVRAAFVPLEQLQRDLEQAGKVNTILFSARDGAGDESQANGASVEQTTALEKILQDTFRLEDAGVKLRVLDEQQALSIESEAGLISDTLAESVRAARGGMPIFSYLANSIRSDDGREIPYSLVTAVDAKTLEFMQRDERGHMSACDASAPTGAGRMRATAHLPPIILNEWAASDLGVSLGDHLSLDYYVWMDEGRLDARTAEFRIACVIPIKGLAADRELTPDYPGISESESLADWDPPFPVDLKRIRPQDEDYWKKYRTTPKAFIPLEVGQQLWSSRFGKLTSLRIDPARGQTLAATRETFEQNLRAQLTPESAGFSILPVRAQSIAASRGATDFGEYFLYFSFFLVISALLLAGLFFKLGIEQRLREIGLLQAVGFPAGKIRALFVGEGALLAVCGSLLGVALALAYAWLIVRGLRTWWIDAVGTRALSLHLELVPFVIGGAGGVLAALVFVVWSLRSLARHSTRSLLGGAIEVQSPKSKFRSRKPEVRKGRGGTNVAFVVSPLQYLSSLRGAVGCGVLAIVLLICAAGGWVGQVAGFFGAGSLLLIAALAGVSARLRCGRSKSIQGGGWWALARLGLRQTTHRPGRSVLCIALIASATFIVVAVEAFRRDAHAGVTERQSGTGSYTLLAETLLPLVHHPNTAEGREALRLDVDDAEELAGVSFTRFRLRPGDDASCLNLYQPLQPRILGATKDFIESNRFSFQDSLAESPAEEQNPWLLLEKEHTDGAVPVVVDANSLAYVLHRKLGDELIVKDDGGQPVRLRVVAALSDSLFQSELLIGESNFLRLFPRQEGYRFFLLDAAPEKADEVAGALEARLSDYGFDAQSAAERLASFHRVENTYLSTFQMLGALGLALGTFGLAAVLLRNVLERRRELALLRAVGYGRAHFAVMILAENALLLCAGLVIGILTALLAIAPAFHARGGQLFTLSLAALLLTVLATGMLASLLATAAALHAPLLPSLRAE
ncbi:FtsX-like permease family protein [soil metagenome]